MEIIKKEEKIITSEQKNNNFPKLESIFFKTCIKYLNTAPRNDKNVDTLIKNLEQLARYCNVDLESIDINAEEQPMPDSIKQKVDAMVEVARMIAKEPNNNVEITAEELDEYGNPTGNILN